MELALWRWSNMVQVTSLVMIAVFYAVMARSVRRAEVRWWAWAWFANFAGLAVSVAFWLLQPSATFRPLVRALYLGWKTAFVLLLIQGIWALKRPGVPLLRPCDVVGGALAFATLGVFLLTSLDRVGV